MRETELKFRIEDPESCRKRLSAAGELGKPRTFEDNILFDDEQGTLHRTGRLLRLRRSGGVLLTFKAPIERKRYKIMEEHEVDVSGFEQTVAILEGLGYRQVARYQKYRTEYRMEGALVTLDETPIGAFIEIEAPEELIGRTAARLGLDVEQGTALTYLELYQEHCRSQGGEKRCDPRAMVFSHETDGGPSTTNRGSPPGAEA